MKKLSIEECNNIYSKIGVLIYRGRVNNFEIKYRAALGVYIENKYTIHTITLHEEAFQDIKDLFN